MLAQKEGGIGVGVTNQHPAEEHGCQLLKASLDELGD